jgi:hypothetical protein
VKQNEIGKACGRNRESENAYVIMMEKREGKGRLGRPRRSWVDNIKIWILER